MMSASSVRWVRRNLFYSLTDAIITVVLLAAGLGLAVSILDWAFTTAKWLSIIQSLHTLLLGTYPSKDTWRVLLFLAIFVCAGLLMLVVLLRRYAGFIFSAAGLISFGVLAAPGIDKWGGLLLSVLLTIIVAIITLPLGILVAFGRQSKSTSLRLCCIGYIEIMRSVPLILIVYWVWTITPLFFPSLSIASFLRGVAGFTLFYVALVSEFVRSGLQAVPKGQAEAARSLGMSEFRVAMEILLPQAIKVALPALVGNVLDIFNGATLVFIIGLTDFLRVGQMILADPSASNQTNEVYIFMFAVYFTIGSAITFGARRLERVLHRSVVR
jgi:general L-amino acid transport system permease protein